MRVSDAARFVCCDTFGSLIDGGIFGRARHPGSHLRGAPVTLVACLFLEGFKFADFPPIDNDWQVLAPVTLTLNSDPVSVCTLGNEEGVKRSVNALVPTWWTCPLCRNECLFFTNENGTLLSPAKHMHIY